MVDPPRCTVLEFDQGAERKALEVFVGVVFLPFGPDPEMSQEVEADPGSVIELPVRLVEGDAGDASLGGDVGIAHLAEYLEPGQRDDPAHGAVPGLQIGAHSPRSAAVLEGPQIAIGELQSDE